MRWYTFYFNSYGFSTGLLVQELMDAANIHICEEREKNVTALLRRQDHNVTETVDTSLECGTL